VCPLGEPWFEERVMFLYVLDLEDPTIGEWRGGLVKSRKRYEVFLVVILS
jgi:hypothetical protein